MSNPRIQRALTQRLLLIQQRRHSNGAVTFQVLGASGSTYTVVLSNREVSCTCPDCAYRGKRCKHIYFVLRRVLGATEQDSEKERFNVSEIEDLLRRAPESVLPAQTPVISEEKSLESSIIAVKRRDVNADPCPICYESMDQTKEDIIYCHICCGHNMHRVCYVRWHEHCKGQPQCPMCRSVWASLKG